MSIEITGAPTLPGGPGASDFIPVLRKSAGLVTPFLYPVLALGGSGGTSNGGTGPAGPTGPQGPAGPAGASGTGTGTVNTGSSGQLAAFLASGTALSGVTLGAGLSLSGGTLSGMVYTGAAPVSVAGNVIGLAQGGATSGQALLWNGAAWAPGSVASTYTLPVATPTVLGGVKPDGTTITIDGTGAASVAGVSITALTDISSGSLGGPALSDIDALSRAGIDYRTTLGARGTLFRRTPAGSRTVSFTVGGITTATLTATDNDKILVLTGSTAGTLAADGTVADGFQCRVRNRTGAALAFAVGITLIGGGTTLPNGATCLVGFGNAVLEAVPLAVLATASTVGAVKPDGTSLTVATDGTMSVSTISTHLMPPIVPAAGDEVAFYSASSGTDGKVTFATLLSTPNIAPYRAEIYLPTDGSNFGAQLNAFFADCKNHGHNVSYLHPGNVTAEVMVAIPPSFDVVGMGRGDLFSGGWGGGVKISSPYNSNTAAIGAIGTNTGNNTSGMVISPGLFNISVGGICSSTKAVSQGSPASGTFGQPGYVAAVPAGPCTFIDFQNVLRLRMANVWSGNDFARVLRLFNVWDSDIWQFSSNAGGFSDPTQTSDNATTQAYTGRSWTAAETAIGRSLGVPAVDIISPNLYNGGDVCNNIRIWSMHLESNAEGGVPFMATGGNGGSIQVYGSKIECNEGPVPMIVLSDQHAFRYEGWLMSGGTGAPFASYGGITAGSPWSTFTHPGVVLAANSLSPRFSGGVSKANPGSMMTAFFQFFNCEDPHVDADVSDGLTRIITARMVFNGCKHVSAARTRCFAPSYLTSVSGANQTEAVYPNGTTQDA